MRNGPGEDEKELLGLPRYGKGRNAYCAVGLGRILKIKRWHQVLRKRKTRLPWKRGPLAFRLAGRCAVVLQNIAACPRHYCGLRRAARLLGVSTQPVRDWIRLGHLRRDGPRHQISRDELARFIRWLEKRAEPFDSKHYVRRLYPKNGGIPEPFGILHHSSFVWPKGRKALTPGELAGLVGCHRSLLTKAIYYYHSSWRRLGRRKSPGRWEISRSAWQDVFSFSRIGGLERNSKIARKPLDTKDQLKFVQKP